MRLGFLPRFRPIYRCSTIFKQKHQTSSELTAVELTGVVRRKRIKSEKEKKDIINSAKNDFIRDRKRPFREPSDAGSDEFNEMKKIHSDTGKP